MDHDPENNLNTAIQMEQLTQVQQNQNPTHLPDLLRGGSYFQTCVPLRKAALEGNWKEAKKILKNFSTARCFRYMLPMPITEGYETILHVATGAGQTTFVKKILKSREQDVLLTLQDKNGNNAFCFAAATGYVEIAEFMLKRRPDLRTVRGSQNRTPLYLAVLFGQHKMAEFLYPKTEEILDQEDVKALFFKSITTGLYGTASKLLDHRLAYALEVARDADNETALHMLARTPSAFANKRTRFFERVINSYIASKLLGDHPTASEVARDANNESLINSFPAVPAIKFNCNTNTMTTQALQTQALQTPALQLVMRLMQKITQRQDQNVAKPILKESLFDAAELGNFEFLAELVRSYPDLIHELDEENRTIFHIAILHRHVNIFKLIYQMGFDMKLLTTYVDNVGNNMLHLAATYQNPPPASVVPGAALELQREILLFKEVEKIIEPTYREKTNSNHIKPKELFTRDHEELRKLGEQWMKSTAHSCMLVATLIATVVFTSAFTVPGGSDDKIGRPIHLNKTLFKIFVMSDATALASSCTSIVIFLSILTSQYREQDFLKSLPLKLMLGLLTLFISVICMMVAFSSSIFLYYPYHERVNWMAISTAFLIGIPIVVYGVLEFPLLNDIFNSTFDSRNRLKPM